MLVVARTAPATPEDRRGGLSILCVDTKSAGYAVGRKLDKIGLKTSDTAELAFTECWCRWRICSARRARGSPT